MPPARPAAATPAVSRGPFALRAASVTDSPASLALDAAELPFDADLGLVRVAAI
jgi:hypothetical protein